MTRSHYTVLTFNNRIYNHTKLNSAIHQYKLHPIKEPLQTTSFPIRQTDYSSPAKTDNSFARRFASRKQSFAILTLLSSSFVFTAFIPIKILDF